MPAQPGSTTMNAGTITASIVVDPAGNNQNTPTQMPCTVVNYIICVEGIFPSRN